MSARDDYPLIASLGHNRLGVGAMSHAVKQAHDALDEIDRLRRRASAVPILCPHGRATSWRGVAKYGDLLPEIEHCATCADLQICDGSVTP